MTSPSHSPITPIKLNDGLIIYERRDGLELVATMTTMTGHATISNRIPWDFIIRSAKKCRPELFENVRLTKK